MGWNQTRPMGSSSNRVGVKPPTSGPKTVGAKTILGAKPAQALGGTRIQNPKARMGPPGQNRIGAHPNQSNAKTGIRTAHPASVGFKNRVVRKAF